MTLEASRVTLARQRAGLSKSALAHKTGTTPRTVTTWESTGPPSSRLHQIATITGMPPEFFSTKEIDLLEEKQLFFRARRRSPSVLLRRSTAFGALGVEFYRSISKHFRTPALCLLDTEFRNSPQEAAMALRLAWGMGLEPAPNLVQMAEAHGIRVLGIPLADVKVDAFSFWSADGRPFIFLSRIKTAERSRFDLAHEIGHLILHSDVTRTEEATDRQIEHEANIFAAEFLLPTESLRAKLSSPPSLDTLMKIKITYGTSAIATARSIYDAGLLSDWGYRQMLATLTTRGFHHGEPGSMLPYEKSRVFSTVNDHLRSRGLSVSDWARTIGQRPDDVTGFMLGQALHAAPDTGTESSLENSGSEEHPTVRPTLQIVK